MSFEFEVIILSYNRPQLLRECLESWVTQDLENTRLLVSDNSTNEQVAEMMAIHFPHIELRKVRPSVPSEPHFNLCREKAVGHWYMLFHDDDLMLPGQWVQLKAATLRTPKPIAIAANAFVLDGTHLSERKFNPRLDKDRLLTKPAELAQGHCFPVSAHQPFPSYLYRRDAVQSLPFDQKEARKYSDTSFLLRVLKRGPVLWLAKPALAYRIHSLSDTSGHDLRAGLMLARHFVAAGLPKTSLEVRSFRAWQSLLCLRQMRRDHSEGSHPWQKKVLLSLVIKHYLSHPGQILSKIWQMTRTRLNRLARIKTGPQAND